MRTKIDRKDLILGIAVTAIWGANFSIIKLGLISLDPFLLTAFRFLLCALPLIFFIKKPSNVKLSVIMLYGLIFGVGLWGLVNLGIYSGLSAGLASLVLQFSAFFTILMSAFWFNETISKLQYLAMLLAVCGLLFIFSITDGYVSIQGLALVLCGALAWSLCNMLVKKYKPDNMFAFIVWSSLFSAIPLFMITYLVKGIKPFINLQHDLNATALGSILFQAYITTIFGYYVWNQMMKKYPATIVAPLSLNVPIFGLLTAYLVFGEVISNAKLLAVTLIFSGIALFLYAQKIKDKK